jgi:hypothetical protein
LHADDADGANEERRKAVSREEDCFLAKRFFGNKGIVNVPRYTTTASDDYRVLEQARAIWKASGQWADFVGHLPLIEHYLPGDYSRAAILVIRGINP